VDSDDSFSDFCVDELPFEISRFSENGKGTGEEGPLGEFLTAEEEEELNELNDLLIIMLFSLLFLILFLLIFIFISSINFVEAIKRRVEHGALVEREEPLIETPSGIKQPKREEEGEEEGYKLETAAEDIFILWVILDQ
jgi:hypothetical protein